MMTMASKSILIFFILFLFSGQVLADCIPDPCFDTEKALTLKFIAFIALFTANIFGIWLRSVKGFNPDRSVFVIMKAFAGGVILATGFVHVLPNLFKIVSSRSSCFDPVLEPRRLFTGFGVLCTAILGMMIDSYETKGVVVVPPGKREMEGGGDVSKFHRFRVMACVLGSVNNRYFANVLLTLGGTNHTCTMKGLITALCFHQVFQGMVDGEYFLNHQTHDNLIKKARMAFVFSIVTPFVVALGMLLKLIPYGDRIFTDAVIVCDIALAAGQLIYAGLVGILAANFMGNKLQQDVPLQIKSYGAVLLGAVGMSVVALLWAS